MVLSQNSTPAATYSTPLSISRRTPHQTSDYLINSVAQPIRERFNVLGLPSFVQTHCRSLRFWPLFSALPPSKPIRPSRPGLSFLVDALLPANEQRLFH